MRRRPLLRFNIRPYTCSLAGWLEVHICGVVSIQRPRANEPLVRRFHDKRVLMQMRIGRWTVDGRG